MCEFDPCSLDDTLDELREIVGKPDAQARVELSDWLEKRHHDQVYSLAAEKFRLALVKMLESKRPERDTWVIAFAAGMECTMGLTMRQVAATLHVSKQAMSKAVNNCTDKLGLRRSRYQMSTASRVSQRLVQLQKHGTLAKYRAKAVPCARMLSLCTIESVVLQFRSWCKRQNLERLDTAHTNWLIRVRDCLSPVTELSRRINEELDARADRETAT